MEKRLTCSSCGHKVLPDLPEDETARRGLGPTYERYVNRTDGAFVCATCKRQMESSDFMFEDMRFGY